MKLKTTELNVDNTKPADLRIEFLYSKLCISQGLFFVQPFKRQIQMQRAAVNFVPDMKPSGLLLLRFTHTHTHTLSLSLSLSLWLANEQYMIMQTSQAKPICHFY